MERSLDMNTENKPKLLVVEDDAGIRKQYLWAFSDYEQTQAEDLESAIDCFNKETPDVVLLDLGLPPDPDNASVGLEFLELVTTSTHDTKVVVITGSEQNEHAIEAVNKGAFDYLSKGTPQELILNALERAMKMLTLEREYKQIKHEQSRSNDIVGDSQSIKKTIEMMSLVSPRNIRILLSGESGTGKELFAQTIHKMSGRKGEFVAINCAAIPNELMESELFGHEKGAFTGAVKQSIGKIERAHGGTLFLDEIGDMPPELQTKLLRFLQEKEIERVGGSKKINVDVRVICATHKNLTEMKSGSLFREDLYYRLAEYTLNIPPLRERGNDVILLAEYYLNVFREELGLGVDTPNGFSDEAKLALLRHQWLGNVRELQNKVKSALVISFGRDLISQHDLGLNEPGEKHPLTPHKEETAPLELTTMAIARQDTEFRMIKLAMEKFDHNVTQAAKSLDISRQTLYVMANRCGYNIQNRD